MKLEGLGEGEAAVAGAAVHGLIDGLAGGGEHQHLFAGVVRGGAQGFQTVGFSGAGGGLQGLHQKR